jgi:hypothetical protein
MLSSKAMPCKLVVKAIVTKGSCLSSFGHFVECVLLELHSLENAKFMHVMRDANNATHVLVKLATTHVTMFTWLKDAPPSIGDVVRRD